MKDWQQGYSLAQLSYFCSLFHEQRRKFVFGAFGAVKERDIATALKDGDFSYVRSSNGGIAAAAIARRSETLRQRDFTGALLPLSPPATYVSAFVCANEKAGIKLLRALFEGRMYVEIFEEDSKAKQAVLSQGLTWLGTKIMAGSEIKGVYGHALMNSFYEPADEATLAVLRRNFLSREEQWLIRERLEKHAAAWEQHYSSYNKRKSWSAFSLVGFSPDSSFIIKPAEMSRAWQRQNPGMMLARPTVTPFGHEFKKEVLDLLAQRLPCRGFERVRFMRLRAKDGELSRHADITNRAAGTAEGKVARFHIPIVSNEHVLFRAWDMRGRELQEVFPERALCYLDQRKPHAATNRDPSKDRVHLVVDAVCDASTQRLIAKGSE